MEVPENAVASQIVDACYHVHTALGPGLLESVYEVVLARELRDRGLKVERQVIVPIRYKNLIFEEGFRADLVVSDLVIIELKSVEEVHKAHKKQVLTYLRLMELRLGLLVNFGDYQIKHNITRIVNGLPE